jgi:hypothetical protein
MRIIAAISRLPYFIKITTIAGNSTIAGIDAATSIIGIRYNDAFVLFAIKYAAGIVHMIQIKYAALNRRNEYAIARGIE